MAFKEGVTEIPDSEDEPLTSSPVEATGDVVNVIDRLSTAAIEPFQKRDASRHLDSLHQTSSGELWVQRDESLGFEQKETALDINPFEDIERTNLQGNAPPQQLEDAHIQTSNSSEGGDNKMSDENTDALIKQAPEATEQELRHNVTNGPEQPIETITGRVGSKAKDGNGGEKRKESIERLARTEDGDVADDEEEMVALPEKLDLSQIGPHDAQEATKATESSGLFGSSETASRRSADDPSAVSMEMVHSPRQRRRENEEPGALIPAISHSADPAEVVLRATGVEQCTSNTTDVDHRALPDEIALQDLSGSQTTAQEAGDTSSDPASLRTLDQSSGRTSMQGLGIHQASFLQEQLSHEPTSEVSPFQPEQPNTQPNYAAMEVDPLLSMPGSQLDQQETITTSLTDVGAHGSATHQETAVEHPAEAAEPLETTDQMLPTNEFIVNAPAAENGSVNSASKSDSQPQPAASPKQDIEQKRPTPAKGSQEAIIDELKAQKTALLASLAALPNIQEHIGKNEDSEAASEATDTEPTDADIMTAANKLVKKHIKLLHEYNEIKDVGQGLMGLIADQRGVRIVEVQDEFGVGPKD